jgi:hydrogenase nickel incorporation protein HypA/HybF
MHELGITRNVVALCTERAGGGRVTRVRLTIGKLSGVLAESVRFCFDVVAKGTPLDGARLEIEEPPGLGRCADCGEEVPLAELFGRCRCGSTNVRVIAGSELLIREMEVA